MANDDMGDEEREDRPAPGSEGFTADILRESTLTGTAEDPPPPDEPQGAGFPRRGDDPDDTDEPAT